MTSLYWLLSEHTNLLRKIYCTRKLQVCMCVQNTFQRIWQYFLFSCFGQNTTNFGIEFFSRELPDWHHYFKMKTISLISISELNSGFHWYQLLNWVHDFIDFNSWIEIIISSISITELKLWFPWFQLLHWNHDFIDFNYWIEIIISLISITELNSGFHWFQLLNFMMVFFFKSIKKMFLFVKFALLL